MEEEESCSRFLTFPIYIKEGSAEVRTFCRKKSMSRCGKYGGKNIRCKVVRAEAYRPLYPRQLFFHSQHFLLNGNRTKSVIKRCPHLVHSGVSLCLCKIHNHFILICTVIASGSFLCGSHLGQPPGTVLGPSHEHEERSLKGLDILQQPSLKNDWQASTGV